MYALDTEMSFTTRVKTSSDRPSTTGISMLRGRPTQRAPERTGATADEVPTEPAPPVHCYELPKFPPDPKLPQLDTDWFPVDDVADPAELRPSTTSTFRPAQVLRHVYRPTRPIRRRSA